MKTKIIEAVTKNETIWKNWGKFMLGRFDEEWMHGSKVDNAPEDWRSDLFGYEKGQPIPVLSACGWSKGMLMVFDLQTGEGALFRPGGSASADLNKHRIHVCVLFEPFLNWLYHQDLSDLDKLPEFVEIEAEVAMYGYRRPGRGQNDLESSSDT